MLSQQAIGNILWDKIYGGTDEDLAFDFAIPSFDSGYIMVGKSRSPIFTGNKWSPSCDNQLFGDYWVIKCDNNSIQWQASFGGEQLDCATSVLVTKTGEYIIGGYSSSPGIDSPLKEIKSSTNFGSYDYWVIKVDANGGKQWENSFGGSGSDQLLEIQESWDGGYILGGHSSSPIGGSKSEKSRGESDIWIVKIDSLGNKIWDRTFGGNKNDWLYSLKKTANGTNYLIGATSYSDQTGEKSQPALAVGKSDFWILNVKDLGNSGVLAWNKTIGSLENEGGPVVREVTKGYVIAGSSRGNIGGDKTLNNHGPVGTTHPDFWVVKLDNNLNIQWQQVLGGTGDEHFKDFLITPLGRYLLAGDSDSQISGDKTENPKDISPPGFPIVDCWVVELNPTTQLKTWDKTIGGLGTDASACIHFADPSGKSLLLLGNALTGYYDQWSGIFTDWNAGADRTENGPDSQDFWMIKFQP